MHWGYDIDDSPATIRRGSAPRMDTRKVAISENSLSMVTNLVMKGEEQQSAERLASKPTHKYRLRKTTLDQVKRWQPEEAESLGEILKQERLAWQAELPARHIPRCPSESDEDQGDSSHMPLSLSSVSRFNRRNTIDIADLAQKSGHETVEVTQFRPAQYIDPQGSFNMPNESKDRKSCFLEGSMNEKSRATASSWEGIFQKIPENSSASSSVVTQEDSSFSTPRPSVSSRTSFSSSIDVSEFKPLPPTPTNFKNTIKRLGHKIRTAEKPPCQPTLHNLTNPPTTTRKGLRKSLSTWKFFDSNASEADSEHLMGGQEASNMTVKSSQSSRTLRLLGRREQQSDSCEREAVFDERKRKAEIAYKEQFGTIHKKQKQDQSSFPPPHGAIYETLSATVRRREPKLSDANIGLSGDGVGKDDSGAEVSVSGLASFPIVTLHEAKHQRTSSQESTGTTGSNRDRLKRVSRGELEKENMQLRTLLRERDNHSRTFRPSNRSAKNDVSFSSFDMGMKPQSDTSATFVDERFEAFGTENVPPIPPLSSQHNSTGLLVSTIRRLPQTDTGTVKRSTATLPASRNFNLPRPLSMVLEDLEDKQAFDAELAVKRASIKLNDSDDKPNTSLQVRPRGQYNQSDELWEWPEDVF